jgi:hypothetical protein
MARNTDRSGEQAAAALKFFTALPPAGKAVVVVLLLVAGAVVVGIWAFGNRQPSPTAGAPVPPGTVVFMFWNVENLFDDKEDHRNTTDKPYDDWFAQNADARKLKYDHLADMILKQNEGKGPDLLACVEVESVRAAELLKDAINAKLPAGAAKYDHVAMKELSHNAGRYIAPCLITRLPIDAARTRLLGDHNLRVLETHVLADTADLTLVVSHWTSQRSDDGSRKGSGRDRYATTIYTEYERLMRDNPDVDFLLCGDLNTPPDSEAVTGELHMTGHRAEVTPTRTGPKLFGLLSGKSAEQFGTHYYQKPLIYDQIGVSPGMLDDKGWGCDPESVRVPTDGMIRDRSRRRPWRFGDKDEDPRGRGYSDHFPVVVNLKVLGPGKNP